MEGADGGVDPENPGRHGLCRVLLAVDEVPLGGSQAPAGFQILKAHFLPELCACRKLSSENLWDGDGIDRPTISLGGEILVEARRISWRVVRSNGSGKATEKELSGGEREGVFLWCWSDDKDIKMKSPWNSQN